MADAKGKRGAQAGKSPPPRRGSFLTILTFLFVFMILFNPGLRDLTGDIVGYVFDPVLGFGDAYPVLTIMLAGTVMVILTTLMRHFTTDWLEMAKNQAAMRHFQKEFGAARKENNTYRMKILQDKQPEVMQMQSQQSMKQMKTMPLTMVVVIPIFAWLFNFVSRLDYWLYSSPWNPTVDMFGTTVFPHWILLYMTLSIPLGALVQKSMKYLSWRNRWQARHPDVHE